jgi:DNA helicase II / ATP-dependent DNA helicase PcrA
MRRAASPDVIRPAPALDAPRGIGYTRAMPPAPQSDLLAGLNEPQQQAVQHRDGPLLVIAGPGSGKTRVITRRAAHLVRTGVPARNILAITFTNKAADEMKRRIAELGVDHGMWVYTFHALGVRLIREFGALARVQPGFTIYDEADSLRVIKEAQAVAQVPDYVLKPDTLRRYISDAKNRLETPAQFQARADWHEAQATARVYAAYEQLLEQRNAVDFDDLLLRVALVLRDHPDVAERLNVRFRYVLIDEYQDTNHAQYLIARYLSQHHGNICATGDPDQSIYAWRGADIRNILEFERDYPRAVIVRLEQNYRSTARILHVADHLIANNRQRKAKALWTENAAGEAVQVWRFVQGNEEAARIADSIRSQHVEGRPWSDFAIFYRVNALSRGLEDELRLRGIPYRIARGVEFYNRKEIRDVLAYLRLLVNPADDAAVLRVINTPARGIGNKTSERLRTYGIETGRPVLALARDAAESDALRSLARKVRPFVEVVDRLRAVADIALSELVSQVLLLSGLEDELRRERDGGGEDRLANVQELVTAALRYEQEVEEPSLEDFLQRISLVSDQDAVDEQAGAIMLMTLHAAKGLEFPVVFLVGLEQGLLPHERTLQMGGNVEEERRLCFVGLTRARERLFITGAYERMIRGQVVPRPPSQFLRELDNGELDWRDFQSRQGGFAGPARDGFVPLVDDLPPEEAARLAPRRGFGRGADDDLELRRTQRPRPAAAAADLQSGDAAERSDGPHVEPLEDGGPSRLRAQRARPAAPAPAVPGAWAEGMLVTHARYGVGQILWVRAGAGQTRAGIRFAGYGEKTLILELAPIKKLERG